MKNLLKTIHPKVWGAAGAAAAVAAINTILGTNGVHLDPGLAGILETLAVALAGYLTPAKKA